MVGTIGDVGSFSFHKTKTMSTFEGGMILTTNHSRLDDEKQINMFSKIEDRYFLHNAFCYYKKQTLIDNPFDEILQGKEDRYWAIDMVNKKQNYLYDGIFNKCNHFYTNNGATWKGIG